MDDQSQICILANHRGFAVSLGEGIIITLNIISNCPACKIVTLFSGSHLCFLSYRIGNVLPVGYLGFSFIGIPELGVSCFVAAAGTIIVAIADSRPLSGFCKDGVITQDILHDAAIISNKQRLRNRCNLDQDEVLFFTVARFQRLAGTMAKCIAGHLHAQSTTSGDIEGLGELLTLIPGATFVGATAIAAGYGNLGNIIACSRSNHQGLAGITAIGGQTRVIST